MMVKVAMSRVTDRRASCVSSLMTFHAFLAASNKRSLLSLKPSSLTIEALDPARGIGNA
jgi:hypothetical protein